MLEKVLVQIYTGDGKGKTTTAFGMALRAAGQCNNVLINQFLKPTSLRLGEQLVLRTANLPIMMGTLDAKWDIASSEVDLDTEIKPRKHPCENQGPPEYPKSLKKQLGSLPACKVIEF
jgi:ATP:corrinoid adenosyltransferase